MQVRLVRDVDGQMFAAALNDTLVERMTLMGACEVRLDGLDACIAAPCIGACHQNQANCIESAEPATFVS
jgi:hypothetical protein